ncbi:hypothetical protein [Levilactobacillus namurensis]|uniref:hypothetical protein n=1 Tax=Levilactobacillus namurensis TaxID=380393 RepID=UPI00222ED44E|nr:hypothetical protein [Levilactobacillus namurensis]MCW3777915.1 hypothetical protein [Levilactobacillus namurensis]MDT7018264.1 hypothetical protein [Levilactobacillus namurensis]WNN64749.1 hypothetical protein RIN67_08495 [Levilactobacillus namurensis]
MKPEDMLRQLIKQMNQKNTDDATSEAFDEMGPQRLIVTLEQDGFHVDFPSNPDAMPVLYAGLIDEYLNGRGLSDANASVIMAEMANSLSWFVKNISKSLQMMDGLQGREK